jgi:integrase
MRTKLTATFIRNASAEPNRERSVYWDAVTPGFGLMVTKTGARSYVLQYRAAGRSRRLTLDASALSLDEARREARKHLGAVAKGADPVAERRQQKEIMAVADSNALEAIALDYFKREGKKIRTMDERRATFERLILPTLGQRQIEDISRRDIVRLLDKVEDERGPVMADKTLAFLSKVFAWHAARSEFRSPIVRGMARTKPKERARDRILTDDEIRAICSATSEHSGPFSSLVRFILLTGTRRNEAARMTYAELHGSDWLIPAVRHKSKREFLLPLSNAAMDVLATIPAIGPKTDGPVFTFDGLKPIRGFSKPKRRLDQASGVTGWTVHDLRRTARSLMSRAGVSADHAERCLGHVIGGIRGVYDRHAYRNEKAAAFEKLAELVTKITE